MITSQFTISNLQLAKHDQLSISHVATMDSSLIANVWLMANGTLLIDSEGGK